MSTADLIIIVIVVIGAVKGYKDGFLIELFSLLGLILGIFAGFKLMGWALVLMSDRFDIDEKYLPYVAFGVVFVVVVILVSLMGKALRSSIDKTFLGKVDQGAGAGLGLIKSVFMMSVAIWIIGSVNEDWISEWNDKSMLMPYVSEVAPFLADWAAGYIPALADVF